MKTYSLSFNQKRSVWIAQIKKIQPDGTFKWISKYLPKTFTRSQEHDAELWLIAFLANFNQTGITTFKPTQEEVKGTTIAFLGPKWLEHRNNDKQTSHNTWLGFRNGMNNWILNSRFPHHQIQDLNIETELTVKEILAWIKSIIGSDSSKLAQINTLKTFFHDCISLEWLNPELANPLDKPAVKEQIAKLMKSNQEDKVITHLSPDQAATLLTSKESKIPDLRRIRYLLALTSGPRIAEIHALTWQDMDLKKNVFSIERQLVKLGCAPILSYKECLKTMTKKEVLALPNALSKPPKRNSKRTLPMHPLLSQALRFWFQKGWKALVGRDPQPHDPVFPRSSVSLKAGQKAGNFLAATAQAEMFQVDLVRLELPTEFKGKKICFHSLRHTFSHLCELAGAEDAKISALLGHGAKSVLRTNYLSSQTEAFRPIINALDIPPTLQLASTCLGAPKLRLVKEGEEKSA